MKEKVLDKSVMQLGLGEERHVSALLASLSRLCIIVKQCSLYKLCVNIHFIVTSRF